MTHATVLMFEDQAFPINQYELTHKTKPSCGVTLFTVETLPQVVAAYPHYTPQLAKTWDQDSWQAFLKETTP